MIDDVVAVDGLLCPLSAGQGMTPLIVAASRGHSDVVAYLLEQGGADPSAKDKKSK